MCALRGKQPGRLMFGLVLRHSVPNKGLHPLRLRLSLRTCHMETVLTNYSQMTSLKIEHIT